MNQVTNDQTTGHTGMKRPFAQAFTDAYKLSTTAPSEHDQSGGLANPFNTTYQDFDDKDPTIDWVKQASYTLMSGVVSTALGGLKLIVDTVQGYYNNLEENSPKRRKLSSTEDNDNSNLTGFIPSGPLPEQRFLDQPAYTSPISGTRREANPIVFNTANNMVSNDQRQLLDQLQADEDERRVKQGEQTTNHNQKPKPQLVVSQRSGPDTPTRPSTANNSQPEPSTNNSIFTPLLWNKGRSSVAENTNANQKTLSTPMFRKNNPVMFSPETTPSFNPQSSNPYSSYGTKFNFKSKPVNASEQEQQLINISKREETTTSDTLADRLRNAVLGTYEAPKTVTEGNELSYDLANSVEKQAISPPTIFRHRNTRVNSQSGGFLKQLQNKRIQLELAKEAQFREKSKKWNEEELPSSELDFKERAKRYSEIVERHKSLQKEVRRLRIDEKEDLKKDEPVAPLPAQEVKKIESYWRQPHSGKVLTTGFKIDITISDLKTLKDREWLNDNIIDFYLSMVTQRSEGKSFSFSTHFYSTLEGPRGYKGVERWAKKKKIDVTKLDRVFVPINRQNTHWCLAVVNNKEKKFEFYDSMGGNGRPALELVREYMVLETERLYPGQKSAHEQNYEVYEICDNVSCPRQENGFDCGVFTCKTVEVLSRDKTLNFTQKDMPNLRRRMAYEIINQKLCP